MQDITVGVHRSVKRVRVLPLHVFGRRKRFPSPRFPLTPRATIERRTSNGLDF